MEASQMAADKALFFSELDDLGHVTYDDCCIGLPGGLAEPTSVSLKAQHMNALVRCKPIGTASVCEVDSSSPRQSAHDDSNNVPEVPETPFVQRFPRPKATTIMKRPAQLSKQEARPVGSAAKKRRKDVIRLVPEERQLFKGLVFRTFTFRRQ
jgi:hypothetical protein